jgi:thioredoxin-related protein
LAGQAQVLRLNVLDDVGGEMALRYNVRGVPTFLLFDGTGRVAFTDSGMPDREEIRAVVADLTD